MSRQASAHPLPSSDDPSVQPERDLDQHWQALFGNPLPQDRRMIAQAIAWKEQVLAHGDVPPHILRDLRIIAAECGASRAISEKSNLRMTSHPSGDGAQHEQSSNRTQRTRPATASLPPASSQLVPGTRLVKTHGDKTHVVEVTRDGLLYEGETYRSLSAVAKHITGTHWNGLLFFGLRRRKTYSTKRSANG